MGITKCTGGKCPLKPGCIRYTAKDTEFQSYMNPPFEIIDGEILCRMFWGQENERLMETLRSITSGKEK